MTKDQYIQHKREGKLDIKHLYQFYLNTPHHTPKVPFEIFVQLFPIWQSFTQSNLENYFRHYDSTWNIINIVNYGDNYEPKIKLK